MEICSDYMLRSRFPLVYSMTDQDLRPTLQETRKHVVFLARKAYLVPFVLVCKERLPERVVMVFLASQLQLH